jgi:hypothetical protein
MSRAQRALSRHRQNPPPPTQTDAEWFAAQPADYQEAMRKTAAEGAARYDEDTERVLAGLVSMTRAFIGR